MPGRGWMAFGAVCSVMVALGVTAVTRADRGAPTSASPLSAGPVTGLPGPAAAVAQGEWTSTGEATLWVVGGQAIWRVTIAGDGTGTVTSTTPLRPGADAVAIACGVPYPNVEGLGVEGLQVCDSSTRMFVLDRGSDAVLVFEPEPDGRLVQKASLAVGSRPSAFVFANFNEDVDSLTDIAVANEGSDDVSILLAREDGTFAPQLRFAAGARPRDVVAGQWDGRGGNDLAVADAGAATVSFLRGDGEGRFTPSEVDIGGAPTALLTEGPEGWIDLNNDAVQDLLVADATNGTVDVFLGRRGGLLPRLASRASLPAGAASEPVALGLTKGLGDERPHALVAARGTGDVFDIPISDTGALGAPVSVLSGAQPAAIHVRDDLTADLASDAVVADASGALRMLVLSPVTIVEHGPGAANVTAGDGLVVWSQRVGANRYRLRIADRSGVRDLPASSSRHPLAPRLGRATDGTPVVTYRRCRARGCTPWLWSFAEGRARPLHLPTARGCNALDLAMWDGVVAFISASGNAGHCPADERGLWIRTRTRRYRISGRATRLGDLRDQRVSWFEGNEVYGRLRVSSLHGRPRTVVIWTADDGSAFDLGLLSGPYVYWFEPPDRGQEGSTLKRTPISAHGRGCRALAPEERFGASARRQVAIDGTRVVYVDPYGVFTIAADPTRWRPCR